MDREAWWVAVHGVTESQTRLSDCTLTFSLSCIGEGNGNPLQCSCLENPRDGGPWWATVYGVTQGQIWLKQLSSSSSTMALKVSLAAAELILIIAIEYNKIVILCGLLSKFIFLTMFNFFNAVKLIIFLWRAVFLPLNFIKIPARHISNYAP